MPKVVDHDHYRRELLLKAFDLFAERGYGSLTMRQLAEGLGVSTGTLYHYFQSKEDVFLRVMEELARQDFAEVEQALAAAGESLEERIDALFAWIAQREDLFIKQLLLSLSFYQEQHHSQELVATSSLLATINEGYRMLCHTYLGIHDPEVVQMIDALLSGAVVTRLFCQRQLSYERQGKLLGQLLRSHLEANSS